MFRRLRCFPSDAAGFTLLEVCIVLLLAMMIIGIAIPSLQGVMQANHAKDSFSGFDALAQDAHARAMTERRAYVLIWSPKRVVLRPDEPTTKAEAEGLRDLPIDKDEVLNLFLPASLATRQGKITAAIWTFWPGGACEPAMIEYKGKLGKWKATYNAFTVQAETTYD